MEKHSPLYTLGFAAAVTIICAVLLGFAATKLKPLQDENAEVDRKSKILLALGLYDASKAKGKDKLSNQDIIAFFSDKGKSLPSADGEKTHYIEKFAINHKGEVLTDIIPAVLNQLELEQQMKEYVKDETKRKYPIFAYYSSTENYTNKKADKYVIPIYGYGLWSNCYGVLALNGTGEIVENIDYYKHGETPGLGGEIEKDYFTDKFKGKKVFNAKGEVALTTTKGEINENSVPAISGATFTMQGVNKMLTTYLTIYDKFFQTKRGGVK